MTQEIWMFKVKLKEGGLNSERRSVGNLANRKFLCKEVKCPEKVEDLPVNLNRKPPVVDSVEIQKGPDDVIADGETPVVKSRSKRLRNVLFLNLILIWYIVFGLFPAR